MTVTQHDPGSLEQWVLHQNAGEPACTGCGVAYQHWRARGEPWPARLPPLQPKPLQPGHTQ
jgi:hypothetical protein